MQFVLNTPLWNCGPLLLLLYFLIVFFSCFIIVSLLLRSPEPFLRSLREESLHKLTTVKARNTNLLGSDQM
ncbi:hypothetical protein Hanom_Chr02g00130441 [Helianthus anomalus]